MVVTVVIQIFNISSESKNYNGWSAVDRTHEIKVKSKVVSIRS